MFALGDYDTTETVINPFNTFTSDDPSASVTITNLAAADVEIHKDGSTTQRASDNGVTVSINFDGVTGNHIISIDLSDNSDDGYYSAGSRYQVRMEGTTVDGATINAWIGTFSIGCTLRPTTAGRKLDVTAGGCGGIDWANVEAPTTAVDLSQTDIQLCDTTTDVTNRVTADMTYIHGTALTETAGQLAGRFVNFFDQASATFSVATALSSFKATGFSTHDAAAVKTAIEAGGSHLTLIKAVTDNLPDSGALTTIGTDAARLTAVRAAVLTDWIDAGRLDVLLDAIPTTAMRGTDNAATASALSTHDGKLDTADTVVDAIKVVTDALTAAAAAKLALSAAGIVSGAAEAGTLSTTQMTTDLSEATDDHYIGAVLVWTSGVLDGQRTDITDYAGATGLLTYTAATEAPSATDTFVIL